VKTEDQHDDSTFDSGFNTTALFMKLLIHHAPDSDLILRNSTVQVTHINFFALCILKMFHVGSDGGLGVSPRHS
jgi:hypothetical protein